MLCYYGGSWTAPRDVSIEIDNVVIAENYIGPYDDSPPRDNQDPQCSSYRSPIRFLPFQSPVSS